MGQGVLYYTDCNHKAIPFPIYATVFGDSNDLKLSVYLTLLL